MPYYFLTTVTSRPFKEGSCITDPCWYAVPGATGKEVAILDLYPNTGEDYPELGDERANC